jgi:hypothetical protein
MMAPIHIGRKIFRNLVGYSPCPCPEPAAAGTFQGARGLTKTQDPRELIEDPLGQWDQTPPSYRCNMSLMSTSRVPQRAHCTILFVGPVSNPESRAAATRNRRTAPIPPAGVSWPLAGGWGRRSHGPVTSPKFNFYVFQSFSQTWHNTITCPWSFIIGTRSGNCSWQLWGKRNLVIGATHRLAAPQSRSTSATEVQDRAPRLNSPVGPLPRPDHHHARDVAALLPWLAWRLGNKTLTRNDSPDKRVAQSDMCTMQ